MITRWQPERLRSYDRFSKMMDDFFANNAETWMPLVDVKETPKELIFVAELPGLKEKDVHVETNGDVLTIRGSREFSEEEKKEDYVRIERSHGTFLRTFALDHPVKPESVHATFKDGLLTIRVPKAESPAPRKVPIALA